MRAYHFAGFVALLFWQIAPTPPRDVPRRGGLFRLGLAYAAGDWEDASFDCDGHLVDSEAVPTRSAGAKFEYLGGNASVLGGSAAVRLTAVAGRWWIDHGSYPGAPTLARTFAGAQIAFEAAKLGFGFGILSHPVTDELTPTEVSVYLRMGRADNLHLRADLNPPTETPGMMGTVRMGFGFGQGPERRAGGFVGLAFGPLVDHLEQAVLVADLAIPVSRHLDLLVRGNAGPGAGTPQWAAGGGLRAVW